MRRFCAALLLCLAGIFSQPAHAQSTRPQLLTYFTTASGLPSATNCLPTNGNGGITASILRSCFATLLNSIPALFNDAVVTLNSALVIGAPTGGGEGIGSINATAYYLNGNLLNGGGVNGGGVTNFTQFGTPGSTNDTPAFNAMLAACATSVGRTCYLPSVGRAYNFTTQPNCIPGNVNIIGDPVGTTLNKNYNGSGGTGLLCVNAVSGDGTTIRGLTLEGVAGTSGGSLISFIAPSTSAIGALRIQDVTLTSLGNCTTDYDIYIDGTAAAVSPIGVRGVYANNLEVFGGNVAAIYIAGVQSASFNGGDVFPAGCTSAASGSVIVTGSAGVPSNQVTINFDAIQAGLIFGNVNNAIVITPNLGSTSGVSVANTGSTTGVTVITPSYPGTVQNNWSNSIALTPSTFLSTASANTFTALQTFSANIAVGTANSATGLVTLANSASANTLTLQSASIATASRTITFPDPGLNDSVAYLSATQTLTNKSIAASEINSGILAGTFGGTGVNNGSFLLTLTGNVSLTTAANGTAYWSGGNLTSLLGTTTTVLHGNASGVPSFTSIQAADMGSGSVDLSTGTIADGAFFAGLGSFPNCSLTATVASNNLTISLTDPSGATPSATDPCWVALRSATLTSGSLTQYKVTAATTLVLNSGSSLACGTTPHIWVELFDTGSAAALGASCQSTVSSNVVTFFPLDASGVASTTACNACGTATSAGTFYTTAALTSKPFRVLGYLEWNSGLSTPGTWAAAPTKIQLHFAGMPLPGQVLPGNFKNVGGVNYSGNACNTTPATVTGSTLSITPTAAANFIQVIYTGQGEATAGGAATNTEAKFTIDRGGSVLTGGPANVIGVVTGGGFNGQTDGAIALEHVDAPASTSALSYTLAISGLNSSGNCNALTVTGLAKEIQG